MALPPLTFSAFINTTKEKLQPILLQCLSTLAGSNADLESLIENSRQKAAWFSNPNDVRFLLQVLQFNWPAWRVRFFHIPGLLNFKSQVSSAQNLFHVPAHNISASWENVSSSVAALSAVLQSLHQLTGVQAAGQAADDLTRLWQAVDKSTPIINHLLTGNAFATDLAEPSKKPAVELRGVPAHVEKEVVESVLNNSLERPLEFQAIRVPANPGDPYVVVVSSVQQVEQLVKLRAVRIKGACVTLVAVESPSESTATAQSNKLYIYALPPGESTDLQRRLASVFDDYFGIVPLSIVVDPVECTALVTFKSAPTFTEESPVFKISGRAVVVAPYTPYRAKLSNIPPLVNSKSLQKILANRFYAKVAYFNEDKREAVLHFDSKEHKKLLLDSRVVSFAPTMLESDPSEGASADDSNAPSDEIPTAFIVLTGLPSGLTDGTIAYSLFRTFNTSIGFIVTRGSTALVKLPLPIVAKAMKRGSLQIKQLTVGIRLPTNEELQFARDADARVIAFRKPLWVAYLIKTYRDEIEALAAEYNIAIEEFFPTSRFIRLRPESDEAKQLLPKLRKQIEEYAVGFQANRKKISVPSESREQVQQFAEALADKHNVVIDFKSEISSKAGAPKQPEPSATSEITVYIGSSSTSAISKYYDELIRLIKTLATLKIPLTGARREVATRLELDKLQEENMVQLVLGEQEIKVIAPAKKAEAIVAEIEGLLDAQCYSELVQMNPGILKWLRKFEKLPTWESVRCNATDSGARLTGPKAAVCEAAAQLRVLASNLSVVNLPFKIHRELASEFEALPEVAQSLMQNNAVLHFKKAKKKGAASKQTAQQPPKKEHKEKKDTPKNEAKQGHKPGRKEAGAGSSGAESNSPNKSHPAGHGEQSDQKTTQRSNPSLVAGVVVAQSADAANKTINEITSYQPITVSLPTENNFQHKVVQELSEQLQELHVHYYCRDNEVQLSGLPSAVAAAEQLVKVGQAGLSDKDKDTLRTPVDILAQTTA